MWMYAFVHSLPLLIHRKCMHIHACNIYIHMDICICIYIYTYLFNLFTNSDIYIYMYVCMYTHTYTDKVYMVEASNSLGASRNPEP